MSLAGSTRSGELREWLARAWSSAGPLVGLAIVVGLFTALSPEARFLRPTNLQLIVTQTAVTATAALGMTLVIASGGIDLSVGSVIALVTVVAAIALNAAWPAAAVAVLCVVLGSFCGLVNGTLVTGLRVVPFIITLGTMGALRGLAKGSVKWLGGHAAQGTVPLSSSVNLDQWLLVFLSRRPDDQFLGLSVGLWVVLALAVLFMAVLKWSVLGRYALAIGSNEATARLCGIRVPQTKILIYTLSGALVGLAGLLQFSRIREGDPTAALGQELDVIAAVVIGGGSLSGGSASVFGSLVGALLVQTLRAGCGFQNWPTAVQEIIIGAIIVAAAALDRLRHRREE